MKAILNMLRGLALLRHPEIVKFLGERRLQLMEIENIRRSFPFAKIPGTLELCGYNEALLSLGNGASLGHGTVLCFGDELNGFGKIAVGEKTWIGQYNNIRASGSGGDIVIGRDCLIPQFCTLAGTNHSLGRDKPMLEQKPDTRRAGVEIGDDVWLGAGVTVLPGARIGRGAVVGANSVVTQFVPEYEIWAGSPAVRIGTR